MQYFIEVVRSQKKMEFLTLRQTEDTSVAEYQARFLTLERFAPGGFVSERERASQFVAGLRLSIGSIVATFSCATLSEAVMRALQCEGAHVSYHQARGRGQVSCQTQGGQSCQVY